MHLQIATLAALASSTAAANTVIGAYIFSRHGDRTPKSLPPVNLTPLGYSQVLESGKFYHDRYISKNSPFHIENISENSVVQSQIYTTASDDNTIQNSAQAFLQALYPPTSGLNSQKLRNGSDVYNVNGGYQLIPIHATDSGTGGEEHQTWLQGASGCGNAMKSSQAYYDSKMFHDTADRTKDFYKSLVPFINGALADDKVSFKNAYAVFDLLNVANIHNDSNTKLPDDDVMMQARTLADEQQFNLAWNKTDSMRGIAGSTLAAQMLDSLSKIMKSKGKSKLGIQFGAYGTFQSFFGLTELPQTDAAFFGLPDYASTMALELVSSDGSYDEDKVSVRFLFRNGTEGMKADSGLKAFSLFGTTSETMPWADFQKNMDGISIGSQDIWCTHCGNSTGECAAYAGAATASAGSRGSNGVSKPVAGVIGAIVAIITVLAIQCLIMLIGGYRLVKKKNGLQRQVTPESSYTKGSL